MRQQTELSRRAALRAGLGTAASLAAPAILRAQTARMVVVSSGGVLEDAYREAIYKPWTQKTGIEIVTGPNPPAKLKAMVDAGVMEWDVMQLDAAVTASAARQNLLLPIDYGAVEKSDIMAGMARDQYVISDLAATLLAWNTEVLKGVAPPADWAQMWDVGRYSAKRGILKRASQTLEIALMADGVDREQLYPLDVERALRSLDKIKSHIFWWETGAQGAEILIDGEVGMAMEWHGRVDGPKKSGAKVDYHLNQALYASDAWSVPKGVKDTRRSMEFVAFAMAAPQQFAYSKLLPYGPVNTKAVAMMDPEQLSRSPSNPAVLKKGVLMDFDWWAENNEKVADRFNRWAIGG